MDDGINGILIINKQYFANKNIPRMSTGELERSIASWKRNIELHEDMLREPGKYYPDWSSFDVRYQEGLKRHWRHEIGTFANDIADAEEELKKR